MTADTSKRCAKGTERRYAGQRYVYSRKQCGNKMKPPHTYCWQHRTTARFCCSECDATAWKGTS